MYIQITEEQTQQTLVLMFVVLSWNKPANAVGAEDGVESEARYEQDRKHKEPVDAFDGNRGQRPDAIFILYGLIWTCFKT